MPQVLTCSAIVMDSPGSIAQRSVQLATPEDTDLVVEIAASGISTGTEKLLWQGKMPAFPGLKYPLIPGYEAVGTVVSSGEHCKIATGRQVFVPGSTGFSGDVRGLFGASAATLVVPENRVCAIGDLATNDAVLLALAATAMHIVTHQLRQTGELAGAAGDLSNIDRERLKAAAPELIVGHGTLGRLLARICVAIGAVTPTVWETNPARRSGAIHYSVTTQEDDDRRDYRRICDVSGAGGDLFDTLIARLARGGHLVLGGFYSDQVAFTFPPAFMREANISIAAEWSPDDLHLVQSLIANKALSLQGLVSHCEPAANAAFAYPQAFNDSECLKMVLDWSTS